jgi:hypothetical protein
MTTLLGTSFLETAATPCPNRLGRIVAIVKIVLFGRTGRI